MNARWGRRLALLVGLSLGILTGCSGASLSGLRDVRLALRVEAGPAESPPDPDALCAAVRRRLAAEDIAADVATAPPDLVTVTLARPHAANAKELLTWRGGLALHALPPQAPQLPLPAGSDVSDCHAAGIDEPPGTCLTGSWGDLMSALPALRPVMGSGTGILLERTETARWRTRIVDELPLLDLVGDVQRAEAAADGALVVSLSTGAAARLASVLASGAADPVVIARGGESLGARDVRSVVEAGARRLRLPLGEIPLAVARADAAATLLSTPVLPVLHVESSADVPPRWGLATANLVLPFLLALAFLAFVRRFDRSHPEPVGIVVVAFGLGCLSVVPTFFAEGFLFSLSPWLNPRLASMGGSPAAFPWTLAAFIVSVGFVEELFKLAAAWVVVRWRREFDEPMDGVVYGAAAALGFAAVENVAYLAAGRMGLDALTGRTFIAMPVHMFLGGTWGWALGRRLVRPRTSVALALLVAAILHGAYDAVLSTRGLQVLGPLLSIGLAVLFTALVRSLLRHGAVVRQPGMPEMPEGRREAVRLGSRLRFWSSAILMYAAAAVLVVVATGLERGSRDTPAPDALALGGLVLLIPLAAFAATAFLPLDVVLDDRGITYAGSRRSWRSVTGLDESGPRPWSGGVAWALMLAVVGLVTAPLLALGAVVVARPWRLLRPGARDPWPHPARARDLGWVILRSAEGDLHLGPLDAAARARLRHALWQRWHELFPPTPAGAGAGAPADADLNSAVPPEPPPAS